MFSEFGAFETITVLRQNACINIPSTTGVYIVKTPDIFISILNNSTSAISEYNGRSLLYEVDQLQNKWVSRSNVLYIGDSSNLKKRVRSLINYGQALGSNHRGGRAIWQLGSSCDLQVGFFECPNPIEYKSQLLLAFEEKYGSLPFANFHH